MTLISLGSLYARGAGRHGERLRAFQDRRLRDVVTRARSVPYYRELLDGAGIEPGDVGAVDEIAMIPSSSKDDLRRWPESERLSAGSRRRLIRRATTGSTGKPFSVLRTLNEELAVGGLWELALARIGARPHQLSVALLDPAFERRVLPRRVAERVGLFRRHHLDARLPREDLAAELIGTSPDLVVGYVSMLARAASVLGQRPTGGWRPRFVFTAGETLTASARRLIESGFGTRPFNMYGAAELGVLAYDCPSGARTMHVCDEGLILEVRRDGRPANPGEAGEVVGTALHSRAMPFIRYETGDRAVRGPQPCPCGWPGTTLLSVEGRLIETFRLPGGRWLHPVTIVGAIADLELGWADEHRLIQEDEDLVVMQFVPLREPAKKELTEIRSRAAAILGPEVRLRVELVDRLAEVPGPKRRPFISRLSEGAATRT